MSGGLDVPGSFTRGDLLATFASKVFAIFDSLFSFFCFVMFQLGSKNGISEIGLNSGEMTH
jgi:hypothetical protein